jgi:hypothetical protein
MQYINTAADSGVAHLFTLHNFYKVQYFKIQNKFYTASESAPPFPPDILDAHVI